MAEFRQQTTGAILANESVFRAEVNASLPDNITDEIAALFDYDIIKTSAQPTPSTKYEFVERDGIEKVGDDWVEKWKIGTKDPATHDASSAVATRIKRNKFLLETDWSAGSDVTMADDMKTYRQALRDIPTHSNFPYLEESDWPTKPS